MDGVNQLEIVSTFLIFFALAIPAYLSWKLKGNMRKLTIALAAFIVLHGIYHIVRMEGMKSVADSVIEPASVLILIVFGLTYMSVSNTKKREAAQK